MLVSFTPEEIKRLISLLKPGNIFKDEYKELHKKLEDTYNAQKG